MFKRFCLILFILFAQCSFANDKTIEKIGDSLAYLIPATAYGSTFYMDDDDGQIQFYRSIATSTTTTFALKYTIKRERPDGSNDRSFPSAHTMFAFQGATFVHQRYGFSYAIAAYLGAAFVGYSRIKADKHYLGDVLAGAAIGSLSSWFFTDRYKTVEIKPMTKGDSYGVTVAYTW